LLAGLQAEPVSATEPWFGPPSDYASIAGGQMTDNEWGELFDDWGSVVARDAGLAAFGLAREWPLRNWGYVGAELQLGRWVGEQSHWELTVPVYYRTPRPRSPLLPSLGYGLGLSFASEPPESEIARTGESTEVLAHWFFELEFGNDDWNVRPYLRLHHRSHAWQTFGARTGSNAVLVGFRLALD